VGTVEGWAYYMKVVIVEGRFRGEFGRPVVSMGTLLRSCARAMRVSLIILGRTCSILGVSTAYS